MEETPLGNNNVENMDVFFEKIYGFKPKKRGAGYELLVGAVLKILNQDASVSSNVFIESKYSHDQYQIDNLLEDVQKKVFVEAKDYSEKVGRGDVTKLSGALLCLPLDKGIMATTKGFTGCAKQYVEDCSKNPNAKPIDLYIIREVLDRDLKERIKEIQVQIFIEGMDFSKAIFTPHFTEEAFLMFQKIGYANGTQINIHIEAFYRKDGSVIETLFNLTHALNKNPCNGGVHAGEWEFLEPAHILFNKELIPITSVEYNIPIRLDKVNFKVGEKPLIYVHSQDGAIEKIISEEQLKSIKFDGYSGSHEQGAPGPII